VERQTTNDIPSREPCCDADPELWAYYCQVTGRPLFPSSIWTEADVHQHLDQIESEKADRAILESKAMGIASNL
jgi:hypothetical protein